MFMSRSAFEDSTSGSGSGSGRPGSSSGDQPRRTGFAAVSRRPLTSGPASSTASSSSTASYGRHGAATGGGMDYYRPAAGPGAGMRPGTAGSYGRHGVPDRADTGRPGSSDGGGIMSAGALPTSSESRSAMLERQRELMKNKLKQRASGGMMMSTRPTDNTMSPSRSSFVPGVRQFSAPREAPSDGPSTFSREPASRESSEAARPATGSSVARPTRFAATRGFDGSSGASGAPTASHTGPEEELETTSVGSGDRAPSAGAGGGGASGGAGDASDGRIRDLMRERDRARMEATAKLEVDIAPPFEPSEAELRLQAHGLSPTYDPKDPNPSAPAPSAKIGMGLRRTGGTAALDLSDMRRFLTAPTPRAAGTVQCYIERDKSGLGKKMYPLYSLYLKDGDRFLLVGKKRAKQKTSNYLISMDASNLNRDSPSFLGKLRSNFVGTEFVVYDNGINPADAKKRSNAGKPIRHELACCTYASNVFGSRGPRKMNVHVPRVNASGDRYPFQPTDDPGTMLATSQRNDLENLVTLINKPPKWNEQVGAYVLNFHGRVTMASVKNFQLVTPEDHEAVLLQFGRVGKDLFTMDYQWPLSPLQAFAICLSSFDYKLACE